MKGGSRSIVLILLLGLAVTAVFASTIEEERARSRAARIRADVDHRQQRFAADLRHPEAVVEFLAAMIQGHPVLSSETFSEFAASVMLHESSVSAVSWNPRVTGEGREAFEAEIRSTFDPDFRIHSVSENSSGSNSTADSYVVRFIEPIERNSVAIGLDTASELVRREAIDRCIETMSMIATPPLLDLVQSPGEGGRFLVVFPIFRRTGWVGAVHERRDACLGVVVGVIKVGELFDRRLASVPSHFDIVVSDLTDGIREPVHIHRADPASLLPLAGEPIARRPQEWAGRKWELQYFPTPPYLESIGTSSVWGIWLLGAMASILLAIAYSIATERARQRVEENTLRTDEERFRLTLGVVSDGWWDWDLLSGRLTLSPSWLRTFGRSGVAPEDGQKMLDSWVHPDDAQARRRAIVEHRRGQTLEYSLEHRIAHADGRYRWVLERGSVVTYDRKGVPVRMVASIQEITLQKLMELERTAMEERLRETQRLESLGLITSGVAHDFNNWLTTIRNNVAISRDALLAGESVEEALAEIESATLQASGLTSQLLDYSGKGAVSSQGIDLGVLALEMRDLLRTVVGKGVSIQVESLGEPVTTVGDPTQLAQVLMNLITNAADAMGGSGTVKVASQVFDVAHPLPTESNSGTRCPAGRYSTLTVTDSGTGMSSKVRARIFEPFYTTKSTGRGLGLSGVQGILRRHDGTIDVQTVPGKGTSFTVYLPYVENSPPAKVRVSRPRAEPVPCSPRKVLVVDDEDGVRESLARLLTSRGHEVQTAASGQEGIDCLEARADEIDLAVLDMKMPGLDGLETFTAMRKLQPNLRAVIISGYSADEVGELPEGLIGYFQKPFPTEQFLAIVGDATKSNGAE